MVGNKKAELSALMNSLRLWGVKLILTGGGGHNNLMVAFKGPNVISTS